MILVLIIQQRIVNIFIKGYKNGPRTTDQLRPLDETDIIVKTGESFEVAFTSTKDINIEKDSYFKTPGGTQLYLKVIYLFDSS